MNLRKGACTTPSFSYSVTTEHVENLAAIAGIEIVVIDTNTNTEMRDFRQELRQE